MAELELRHLKRTIVEGLDECATAFGPRQVKFLGHQGTPLSRLGLARKDAQIGVRGATKARPPSAQPPSQIWKRTGTIY